MPKIVIADTSCLIVLDKLSLLELLNKLYSEVITTPEIASEYSKTLPLWIKVIPSTNPVKAELNRKLDAGEASAISLALDVKEALLILDDLQARKVAAALLLNFTGTLGVLVKAKQSNLLESIKPILRRLKNVDFRISSRIEDDILKQCGES